MGPRERSKDTWTVFRIMAEFVEGFERLAPVWPAVSIFGGSRVSPRSRTYADAVRIGELLARAGFAVITGGGPGAMEAANLGARRAGGRSIGLNIKLPHQQAANPYADLVIDFDYFFARKVMFVKYACAFVGLPGGYGTFDEVFECLTLRQTRKIRDFPVILYGTAFWEGLVRWLEKRVAAEGLIATEDLELFALTDDPEEVVELVRRSWERRLAAQGGGSSGFEG